MKKLDIKLLITEFFTADWCDDEIEIYNEFSLQHELGLFLRKRLEEKYQVQFERNISYFGIKKENLNTEFGGFFVKKEIDICIFDKSKNEKYAIELKFPTNGQVPEQMFSFIKDIKFMEQVKELGFADTFCVCLVNNSDFYELKGKNDGIYSYFRTIEEIPSKQEIEKPTGKKDQRIILRNPYKIDWNLLPQTTKLNVQSMREKEDRIKFYIVQIKEIK